MMPLDRRLLQSQTQPIANLDSWAGYDAPRQRLARAMRRRNGGRGNVVVLTGDEHQNHAGIIMDGDRPAAVEFVSTSIASGGDGSDLRPGSDVYLANNPALKFVNDQRGYLICDVTPDAWATQFMVMDRVSAPGGVARKRATATVARGAVGVRMG
jgi:alkaline phosphatase D